VTFPSPWPLAEVVSDIHDAWDDALHVQSRSTTIETVPTPPAESKEAGDVDAAVSHRPEAAGEGAATLVVAELPQATVIESTVAALNAAMKLRNVDRDEQNIATRRIRRSSCHAGKSPAFRGEVWYNKSTPAEQF